MHRPLTSLATFLLVALAASAQTRLHLKNAPTGEDRPGAVERSAPVKSRSINRFHVLARFEQRLAPSQLMDLGRRGVRLVQFVPDQGYVFSLEPGMRLEEAGLLSVRRFQAQEKISPALKKPGEPFPPQEYLVAEFHPGTDVRTAREIVEAEGFRVSDRPNILGNHLLILGPRDAVPALASWDELAYVFPASEDLAAGRPVHACPGALTDMGPVGQYVATVGEGWDGEGRGSAQLGYYFRRVTERLPAEQVRQEFLRAFSEWSRVASVSFLPAPGADWPRSLDILFASRKHGDAYPFDGPGRALAHTYYPAPPNPETIAGDLHFDDDEEWVAGPDLTVRSVDLYSVALHELGHALGLGHSDMPGAVMYPYYRRLTALTAEDIGAVQDIYASSEAAPDDPPDQPAPLALIIGSPAIFPVTTTATALSFSGTVSGGTGDVLVDWASDRSGAGLAQGGRVWTVTSLPLLIGNNVVTLTATDSASIQTSRTVLIVRQEIYQAPSVSILSPTAAATYATASASITLSGAAAPSAGIVRVEWANSRGGRGTAVGTSPWTAGPLPLQAGDNVFTVTAFDSQGASASRALTVTYALPYDTVAPSLKITSPASTSVLTSAATIQLRGTASDNVGVAEVTWSTSFNKSGVAIGTSNWSTSDIPLLIGTNTIVVRARDAAGNTSWRSVTVTRR